MTMNQNGTSTRARRAAGAGCVLPLFLLLSITAHAASRTDVITYADDKSKWVLGQLATSTNVETGLEETRIEYDPVSAKPHRIYAFGKLKQTLQYYGGGTLKSISDGRDSGGFNTTITFSSWKRGVPQRVDFPDGTYKTLSVDDYGLISWSEDENRFRTCHAFDAMGRLALTQYPLEGATGTCDATAQHWFSTSRTFEPIDTAEYGLAAGHWRELVRTSRNYKYVYYDALWRPVLTRTYDSNDLANTLTQTITRYDAEGRPIFASYPTRAAIASFTQSLPGVRTTYDALGRSTRVEQDSENEQVPDAGGGVLVSTTQYLDAFTTRSTNPRGKVTVTQYRTLDTPTTEWPSSIAHPNGATTDIHRNTFGLPTTLTRRDATTSVSRTYAYSKAMELCRLVEPETGATLNGYDAAGNLKWSASGLASNSMCDAEGDTTAIIARRVDRAYDQRNRLAQLTFPDGRGNTTYAYTNDGLPDSVTVNNFAGNAVTTGYAYNARRLMTSETMAWDSLTWPVTYAYNKFGHVLVQGYPGGVNVNYAPNALGQATQAGTYATNVAYHPNGAIKGFTYGNGIVHSLTQNTRQLPLRRRDALANTPVLDDSYDYDRNGNLLAISDATAGNRGDRDMAYNSVDQLIQATSTTFGGTIKYTYDAQDNIATLVGPGRNLRYCYNGKHQLAFVRASASSCTSGSATTSLTYDWQGNVASKNNVAYDFDFGNRLRSVTNGATTSTYVYDAAGRRVRDITGSSKYSLYTQAGQLAYTSDGRKRVTENYIHLGGSLIATRTVPFGSSTATVEYQHTDALGTPVAVTNASGAVVRRSEYEPYGKVLNRAVLDGPGFTGHVEDAATGLTYMQQRYFDAKLGIFESVDPVTADTVTGWNFCRYCYAANNPYKFKDPDGRIIETGWDLANVAMGLVSLGNNLAVGNYAGSAVDVGGLIVDVAATLVPVVPGGAGAAIKAARLAENVRQGANAERSVAKELGESVAGKRVTLEASTGQRSVADIVTNDKGIVEVKSGNAQLSSGQKAVKADIDAGRSVTPRGTNAEKAGLEPGKPTQLRCYEVKRC
jgi:RHS repeat-associated protein